MSELKYVPSAVVATRVKDNTLVHIDKWRVYSASKTKRNKVSTTTQKGWNLLAPGGYSQDQIAEQQEDGVIFQFFGGVSIFLTSVFIFSNLPFCMALMFFASVYCFGVSAIKKDNFDHMKSVTKNKEFFIPNAPAKVDYGKNFSFTSYRTSLYIDPSNKDIVLTLAEHNADIIQDLLNNEATIALLCQNYCSSLDPDAVRPIPYPVKDDEFDSPLHSIRHNARILDKLDETEIIVNSLFARQFDKDFIFEEMNEICNVLDQMANVLVEEATSYVAAQEKLKQLEAERQAELKELESPKRKSEDVTRLVREESQFLVSDYLEQSRRNTNSLKNVTGK